MIVVFEPMDEEHRQPVIDILNHYVEHSFAAYIEQPVPYEAYGMFLKMAAGYPAFAARDEGGRVVGFGMLRAHNPFPTFVHTAEVSYFLHPDHCGRGIGTLLLERLLAAGRERGITTVLASISSLNEGSIRFHAKHGFVECGRFQGVCRKKGQALDTVWMQKTL